MLALGARMKLRNADLERWVDAQDFFLGMFTTAIAPDEMLVEIELPFPLVATGWSFLEVAPRAGDYALMGIAAAVTLDETGRCKNARLVYLNAGDGPVDAREAARGLAGQVLNDEAIDTAAAVASQREINPFGNIHASPDYQLHLANVLTKKALKLATQRAGESYPS
jgi:carbon-monoxide dehydrogenase medium subunit